MPRIVTVNITDRTQVATTTGFGLPLIFTKSQTYAYKKFDVSGGLTDLVAEFAVTTDVYKIASAMLAQSPHVAEIAVYGLEVTNEKTAVGAETLTQDTGNVYDFANSFIEVGSIVNFEDNSVAIPDSDIEEIDYENGKVTFATPKTSVTVDSYNYFNALSAVTTALTTLRGENDEWRYIVEDFEQDNFRANKELAVWVESNDKIYSFGTTIEDYPVDLTSYDQTIGSYHDTTLPALQDEKIAGAVVGYMATHTPGSYTLSSKTLGGLTVDSLTLTQQNAILSNRINVFVRQNGLNSFFWGYAGSGFIDSALLKQYVASLIEVNIATLLAQQDKVPFTDVGINQIGSEVSKAADSIVASGGAESYSLVVPARADLSQGDIANRIIRGIQLTYVEAGAIHTAVIDVVVTL